MRRYLNPSRQTPPTSTQNVPAGGTPELLAFLLVLKRLQCRKGIVLGVGSGDLHLEYGTRLARIGINRQEQRVGRKPAKVDDAVDDGLRRIGDHRWLLIVLPFLDQVGQPPRLG